MSQALCRCCGYRSEQNRDGLYGLCPLGNFSADPKIKQGEKMLKNKDISGGMRVKEMGKKNTVKVKTGGKDELFGVRKQARADRLQMLKEANV